VAHPINGALYKPDKQVIFTGRQHSLLCKIADAMKCLCVPFIRSQLHSAIIYKIMPVRIAKFLPSVLF